MNESIASDGLLSSENEIPSAVQNALNTIITEHFSQKLDALRANFDELMRIFDIEGDITDFFPYGRIEFTTAQAHFIRDSLRHNRFVVGFTAEDTAEIRKNLSNRLKSLRISGNPSDQSIEKQIKSYLHGQDFIVDDGFIGIDATEFLVQCKKIVRIGFIQLLDDTIKPHLQYLKAKATGIRVKAQEALNSNTQIELTVLEESLTRGMFPTLTVTIDGTETLILNLFSAPIGIMTEIEGGKIVGFGGDSIEGNAYGESIFQPGTTTYPFMEGGLRPSFYRFFFGDSPFKQTEGWIHWGNLDTASGRFLSSFLDPRKNLKAWFDQYIKEISLDPEMGLELLSEYHHPTSPHSSLLPGSITFRVRTELEKEKMIELRKLGQSIGHPSGEHDAQELQSGKADSQQGGSDNGGGVFGLLRRFKDIFSDFWQKP